jgi:hypothetical protein
VFADNHLERHRMPLTTGVDAVTGGAGDDVFGASNTSLSSLDVVDGGTGNDTLNLIDATAQGDGSLALPAGITVKNIETLNIASNQNIGKVTSTAAVFDVSGFTGVTTAKFVSTGATNGSNIKVGAGVTTSVTTAAGATTVAGGVNTTVVAQGAVIVSGADLTAANVVTATSSAQVDIGSASNSATAIAPKLVSAVVKGGSAINIADYDGATSAASTGTLTTVTISETGATAAAVKGKALTNLNIGKQTTTLAVTVTNATTDHTLSVSLADSGKTSNVVSVIDAAAKTVAVTSNGTANVAKLGDGSTSNTTTTAVTIAGAGALTLDVDASRLTAVASIDGSAATGNLTLSNIAAATKTVKTGAGKDAFTLTATAKATVDAGAGNDVVTLGSTVAAGSTVSLGDGNDQLVSSSGAVAASTAASGSTPAAITVVDGGAGTDVLAASLVNAGNGAQFINFETLGLTNSTVDVSLLTGSTITALELLAGGGTYTNITTAQSLAANTTTSNTTTLTFSGVSGSADSYAINLALDNSAATTDPTSANMAAGTIAAAGIENFTIVSGGSKAWNSITLGADSSANTVVVSGASNLNLAFASGFGDTTAPKTGVSSIDGSAATGKLDINTTNVVAATAGLTVKGGSAADVIVLAGAATVLGGDGADDITVAAAGGTLTGGAGADIFRVANGAGTTPVVTIADLAAGDKIQFASSTVASQTTMGAKIDVSAATTLAGAFAIVVGTAGYGTNEPTTDNTVVQGKLAWFQYAGNTYVYDDNMAATDSNSTADDAAAVSAEDVIIKITGLVDLANSTVASDAVTIV